MEENKNTIVDSVEKLEEKIAQVREAQRKFATYTQEQVDKIFFVAASAANKARIPLAKMAVAETGMGVVELTKENFEEEVLAAKVPVLIDFWADWCGPCKMQSPIVDQLAEEYGDRAKICKVNVDEQPALALNYQVTNIPTLVFMKYGIFQERMIGLQSRETIQEYLETLLDAE